jgi:tetratricopeptide (TPR) repeat protein
MKDSMFLQANEFLKAGNATRALQLYYELIQNDPQNALAYQNAAVIEGDLGNYDKALSMCLTALEIDHQLIMPNVTRAYIFDKLENKEESRKEVKRALEKNPESPEALCCAGILSLQENKLADAKQYLEKAVQVSPSFYLAQYQLVVVYQNINDRRKLTSQAMILLGIKPNVENMLRFPYILSRAYRAIYLVILVAACVLSLLVGPRVILLATIVLVALDLSGGIFLAVKTGSKPWRQILDSVLLGIATGITGLILYSIIDWGLEKLFL